MVSINISSILSQRLKPKQDYIFGFADLNGLLIDKFNGYSYGISIGKRLSDEIVDNLYNGPTIEYFKHYQDVNKELLEVSQKITSDLLDEGIHSLPIIPTISLRQKDYEEYLENLTYDISHKMVATRAGLGWIGKTDLFISKEFGPRLRLVTILLKEDPGVCAIPVDKSKCGRCIVCVDRCPGSVANGKLWDIHTHRDEFFDARKCRETCGTQAKQKLGIDERICGLCVTVCPIGRKNKSR